MQKEKVERNLSLKRKHEMFNELLSQHSSYRNLAARNARLEQTVYVDATARILVPFLLVRTRANSVINCEVDDSRTEYFLNFTMPFEIQDDHSVLTQLGLAQGSAPPTIEQLAAQLLSDAMGGDGKAQAAAPTTTAPPTPAKK